MRPIIAAAILAFLPLTAAAQEQPAETPKPQAQPSPKPAETGQAVNLKIDITITDQGGVAPAARTVTLLVADGAVGRIRTASVSAVRGELNVDARPRVLQTNHLLLNLTVEYRPGISGASDPAPSLSQSLAVILQDGKPLVISQSADPNSDRTVRLEVKATILK